MGTEKRERQKANRQLKLQEIAKQQVVAKRKRQGRLIAVIVGGLIVLVGAFYLFGRSDSGEDQASAPGPSVTNERLTGLDTTVPPIVETTLPVPSGPFEFGKGACAPADGSADKAQEFTEPPAKCIVDGKTYTAEVETNMGKYTMELDPAKAPGAVNNFVNLARFHYFDDTVCHRAIPGFMVQCGDPTATGGGDPGYSFADELPAAGEYELGSVAMANSGPNTNGSQFFVITGDQGVSLPPSYVLFGKVTDGFDTTVKAMDEAGNPADNGVPPLKEIKILKVTITEK